jgi:hypothetical protein
VYSRRTIAPTLIALLSASALNGCYQYVPLNGVEPPVGQEIRVEVTRRGLFELGEVLPTPPTSGTVEGRAAGTEGSDLLLSVPVAQRSEGFLSTSLTQTVRIPMAEILAVSSKHLDRTATGVLVAAAGALSAGLVMVILNTVGGSGGGGELPIPPDFAPVGGSFSMPWGR